MKACALLLCLLHAGLSLHPADAKRFDPAMVDPLTRRSPLDKNFMRFGRSSPSFTEEDEIEGDRDAGVETSKEENFLRSMRGKENLMRFGRAKSDNFMRFGKDFEIPDIENIRRIGRSAKDNFMRFGRAKNENFMRFGRRANDNFMRFGRGKQDSFIRFGRGKQDSYMRFGRGKGDNFMRFGRAKPDSFIRFGRGKQDSYMRFGRGKGDNFMRFGRASTTGLEPYIGDGREFSEESDGFPNTVDNTEESELNRDIRGKQENFMRFGKSIEDDLENSIPIAMRSANGNSNFMRFGRASSDSSSGCGKSDNEHLSNDESCIPDKKDGFFPRFGRSAPNAIEESSQEDELIPQRLKRSISESFDSQNEIYASKLQNNEDNHGYLQLDTVRDDLDGENATPVRQEDFTIRRKRSLNRSTSTPSPFSDSDTSVDIISAKLRFDTPVEPEYRSSLFSAGLPNVIVGPEFSLLPDINPPPAMLKKGRPGDQNFLRLG